MRRLGMPLGNRDMEIITMILNKASLTFVIIHGKDVYGKHVGSKNGDWSYR